MHIFVPILAVDIGTVIGAVIVIGAFAIRALLSMGGGNANKPRPAARPQPPPGAGQNKPLRNEVEEFLRRAKANQPGKVKTIDPPARGGRSVVKSEVIGAEVIEAEVFGEPRGEGVAAHVERHIAPNPVAEHTRQLGREIGQADEDLESHLHQTFDHKLGQLGGGSLTPPTQIAQGTDADVWKYEDAGEGQSAGGPPLAAEIIAMFREPEGARKAIVLSEILNPPEHRWE
jgi:hypothetical protein